MNTTLKAIFFAVAVVLFLCEAFNYRPGRDGNKPQWGWLGLAVFAAVWAVDAMVAVD